MSDELWEELDDEELDESELDELWEELDDVFEAATAGATAGAAAGLGRLGHGRSRTSSLSVAG